MTTYPLWKSFYYESAEDSIEYRVLFDGVSEIFRGKAYRSPKTGLSRIRLNDICASFLDSVLDHAELRRAENIDTLVPMNAYAEFTLEVWSERNSRWDTVKEWAVVNDTSWEERYTGEGTYSEPINGHAAPNQMVAFSYLVTASQPESICYNGTSIYFTITKGGAEETSDSGGTWEIDYETNLENAYYEMAPVNRMGARRTGYTSGGSIEFELPENEDVFQTEYEAVFWSEPDGFVLGRAVAYVGAGEGESGFTYFLSITSAPTYISSAGTRDAVLEYRTNCDGQIKWELSSSSTRYTGYSVMQTGVTGNLERLALSIPANPVYEPRYYQVEIFASDAADPYNWIVSAYTGFEQQDRQHYFFFTTAEGQTVPWSATTNSVTWATDYEEINYEIIRDNAFDSSGTSSTGGVVITLPQNGTPDTVTYTLNAFTTGGTPLGTITFYHLDESEEYTFEYFGIHALSAGTIGIKSSPAHVFTLEYSKNNGEWTPISTPASLNVSAIGVNAGDKVRFRGDTYPYSVTESGDTKMGLQFVISGAPCEVYGNILSLTYGDNFSGATAPHGHGNYAFLFANCTALQSAKNLYLPAPYENDYEDMFFQCTGLTTPPKIPSSTAPGSYKEMFIYCRSLAYAPSLRAVTADTETYYSMFEGCTALTEAPVISATTVNARACKYMFEGCSGLTSAPTLNAVTVGDNGYERMFRGCRSLTAPAQWAYTGGGTEACKHMYSGCTALISTPNLPAVNSAGAYYGMFEGCTALTTTQSALTCTGDAWTDAFNNMFHGCASLAAAPSLSGIYTIPERGFASMFAGCTSLSTPPELPSSYVPLARNCFQDMFEGCTGLTSAPALPWTTLAEGCYQGMFRNCSLLETAPSLPATALTPSCYAGMFQGCRLLTTAPILRAAVVPKSAYSYMFNWCLRLDYIECLATDISAEDSTLYFTSRVKSTGVFIKSSSMNDWEYGENGIPEGWTVENI